MYETTPIPPHRRAEEPNAGKINRQSNNSSRSGAIAQLGERVVRNDEAVGSSPTSSTMFLDYWLFTATLRVTGITGACDSGTTAGSIHWNNVRE